MAMQPPLSPPQNKSTPTVPSRAETSPPLFPGTKSWTFLGKVRVERRLGEGRSHKEGNHQALSITHAFPLPFL